MWCAPSCKGSPDPPGDALGAVGFPDGQLAEYYQNPSLELNVVLRGQDWAEKKQKQRVNSM
jgi:hypothetical protein